MEELTESINDLIVVMNRLEQSIDELNLKLADDIRPMKNSIDKLTKQFERYNDNQ